MTQAKNINLIGWDKMKIALDKAAKDCTLPKVFQLRTPLTGYRKQKGVKWALDNGCYTQFHEVKWLKMAIDGLNDSDCVWITLPDEVGGHRETLNLFKKYRFILRKLYYKEHGNRALFPNKLAFVLQDGCHISDIPWAWINCIFLGGSTKFKYQRKTIEILEKAKSLGKWVHIGRVNTKGRIVYFYDIADSIDGSGLAKYSKMLEDALDFIN